MNTTVWEDTQDSGVNISESTNSTRSDLSLENPARFSRWQRLIEEGQTISKRRLDQVEPKEWIRKQRLLLNDVQPLDEANMSPTTRIMMTKGKRFPMFKR